MRILRIASAAIAMAGTLATSAPAQTLIQTGGTGNAQYGHRPGDPNVRGQTFTAPTIGNALDFFAFFLGGFHASPTQDVQAFVIGWDPIGLTTTGSVLFQSAIQQLVVGSHTQHTFNTGGLLLNPGAMYIAFVRLVNPVSGIGGSYTDMLFSSNGQYAGGQYVYGVDNADGTTTWSAFSASADANFTAQFSTPPPASVTPEPASMILLGSGLAGLAAVRRRRKRNQS